MAVQAEQNQDEAAGRDRSCLATDRRHLVAKAEHIDPVSTFCFPQKLVQLSRAKTMSSQKQWVLPLRRQWQHGQKMPCVAIQTMKTMVDLDHAFADAVENVPVQLN